MRWIRRGMVLTVESRFDDYSDPDYILNEAVMDPIQQWCWQHTPTARRLSFDTFQFKSEADIILFLLKWSG